jgi:hypothetical protein
MGVRWRSARAAAALRLGRRTLAAAASMLAARWQLGLPRPCIAEVRNARMMTQDLSLVQAGARGPLLRNLREPSAMAVGRGDEVCSMLIQSRPCLAESVFGFEVTPMYETCRQRRLTCSISRRSIRKNPRRVGDS